MLISEIDAYLATAAIKESTFGIKISKDPRLLARLRSGGSVTLRTAEKIRAYIRKNRTAPLWEESATSENLSPEEKQEKLEVAAE